VARYKDATSRAVEVEKDTLVVMAADLIQNESYYNQENFTQYPWNKIRYFIEFAEPTLADEPIWQELDKIKQRIYATNNK